MKLVSVAQMKAIEKEADAAGLTYDQMMENAGNGLAELLLELVNGDQGELEILGLVGPGNNGGDTLVALSNLARRGWKAHAYLISRKQDAFAKQLLEAGGDVASAADDRDFKTLSASIKDADILVDGVLGTGVKLPLKEEIGNVLAEAIYAMANLEEPPLVVAVDCPSGVDCDTGDVADECIPADLTVTMAAVKQGLLILPAFEYVGELKVIDIGIPEDLPSLRSVFVEVADEDSVSALLPERPADAHKGTFGTALIAAGSFNYTGAALLAGQAAFRIGAGLVTLAIPGPLHAALAGQFPEATWVLLPHAQGVIAKDAAQVLARNFERATALLIGPGLGSEDTTREFIQQVLVGEPFSKTSGSRIGFVHEEKEQALENRHQLPPLVIDADGLKLLAKIKDWPNLVPGPAILTPHPGEMAVLTGSSKEEIQENRQAMAAKCAAQWGHVVVLKGAFTIVAAPDGRVMMIPVASSALARAGTGDVLAGLIVGLRAQGLDAFEAAVAGAWIHARAGLYAADDLGTTASVLAGDVLNSVSDVLSDLE
jgi:ADP-dependent NAD(P)H-hydrate dehydratase / NAD(P)H-hydrate epimerase